MSESFDSYCDRQLVLDHEADPEAFRQPIQTVPIRTFTDADRKLHWRAVCGKVEILSGEKWEPSIFTSAADLMACLDVTETTVP